MATQRQAKGQGRGRTVAINFRTTPQIRNAAHRLAKADNRTLSNLLEHLILQESVLQESAKRKR